MIHPPRVKSPIRFGNCSRQNDSVRLIGKWRSAAVSKAAPGGRQRFCGYGRAFGVPKHSELEPDYFLAKGNGPLQRSQQIRAGEAAKQPIILNPKVDWNTGSKRGNGEHVAQMGWERIAASLSRWKNKLPAPDSHLFLGKHKIFDQRGVLYVNGRVTTREFSDLISSSPAVRVCV